jgi:prepilin-type N-terminal cleavage/methylation domain-containing protein
MMNSKGYTLIELLVATFLTGLLALGGLKYYVHVNNHTLTQEDISEMQQAARNNLAEIAKTLGKAGFKVGSHAPYAIAGDTLFVYYSDVNPIDTVAFYLQEGYGDGKFYERLDIPRKMLMRRLNSNPPDVYGEQIESLKYRVVSPTVIDIVITVGVDRPDEDYEKGNGVRRFTLSERVQMRNLKL